MERINFRAQNSSLEEKTHGDKGEDSNEEEDPEGFPVAELADLEK